MERRRPPLVEDLIYSVLKDALSSENKAIIDCFGITFIRQLINSTRYSSSVFNIIMNDPPCFKGYPSGNYLKQIAKVLELWSQNSQFPIKYTPLSGFSTEITQKELESLSHIPECIANLLTYISDSSALTLAESLLISLGPRGILFCLGVRRTQGSTDKYMIPQRSIIEKAFSQLYSKEESKSSSNLSVGARSLTKHAHRSSEGFWGKITGTDNMKNNTAQDILRRLLNEAAWVNVHCLPNEEAILEIRVSQGYGARWIIEKKNFRGFVEPMMEGGHEKGWKH
ncbi:hypothetical protein SteCoe_9075 [Stentor coeruleus]|uniref:Uncharacterized protein n=1 Tax=Stentor coeruleus TaxID=5963 RepID=A0A1R2CIP9_9CILI|nr:hypothetical protein SteCoe_9075 [Stentor coeruleus]